MKFDKKLDEENFDYEKSNDSDSDDFLSIIYEKSCKDSEDNNQANLKDIDGFHFFLSIH